MFNTSEQTIESGNNNIQAGGNVVQEQNYIYNNTPIHITVYEKDIFNVIEQFDKNIDLFEELDFVGDVAENTEYDFAEKAKKNQLNKLSDEYFSIICEDFLPFFYKIDAFLFAPQNKKVLKKYQKVALQLKIAIQAKRDKFDKFEAVLDDIANTLMHNIDADSGTVDATTVVIFLNYMYWNCDIGRKQ